MQKPLGVAVVGIGWVAIQHLTAFSRNPHARVTYLVGRNEARARARLQEAGLGFPDLEPVEVSAYSAHFTRGYQWPTSIVVNAKLSGGRGHSTPLAHVVSSTDFQMPYAFGVEMMGDKATLRDDLILWNDVPLDLTAFRSACPYGDVGLREDRTPTGAAAIRVVTEMPGSADVSHHPFQGEIDELVACILEGRETHLNVYDAQKTMEFCIAADRSAEQGGKAVRLPLL